MDPALGRFLSRDQIGLWGDENNLGNPFSYVGNNPWSYVDPHGEYVESAIEIASIGLGVASITKNWSEGNVGGVALDALGLVVDGAALAVPLVPGRGWTEVQDLLKGDEVRTMGGDTRPVTGIEVVHGPTMV